ncbi:MAG TPA: hypothetical protein VGG33_11555 [Polyangia bacterium]
MFFLLLGAALSVTTGVDEGPPAIGRRAQATVPPATPAAAPALDVGAPPSATPPVAAPEAAPAATEVEAAPPDRRFTITTPAGRPLQGPHPFRQDNALSLTAGYGFANQLDGVRGAVGYGRAIAGSLWFDLRIDLIDSTDPAPAPQSPPCTNCAQVDTLASVLGGLSYRLRADIPVIPYGSVTAGPVFLFNSGARGAVGFALRAAAGARYYLHEWIGFGIELGAVAGGAVVDEDAGLSSNVAQFDLGLSAEYQF